MINKLLLSGLTLANSSLLILMLLLGSQNLSERHNLNLGITSTEKLPAGFLIGISIVLGSLSGGLSTLFFIPNEKSNF